jgi:hypothetical protein
MEDATLPLLDVTHEFLALVEKETGYPVKLLEDPNLPTFAKVHMARGNVPAHFVYYKPTRDESLDYMICFECGFVLRLFENPPDHRFSLGGTAEGEHEVLSMLSGPGGSLTKLGLQPAQLEQMASSFFSGLHLVAIEYVAFKQVMPQTDMGFDLAQEYAMALGLYRSEGHELVG